MWVPTTADGCGGRKEYLTIVLELVNYHQDSLQAEKEEEWQRNATHKLKIFTNNWNFFSLLLSTFRTTHNELEKNR